MPLEFTHRGRSTLPQQVRSLLEAHFASEELELPFLPDTASQVMSMCNEESCDARQLSEMLQRDQSLAAHVLKVANSAAYAPKEPIVSLQQAVSRLGMSTICEISIAASLSGKIFRVPGYQADVRRMWMHSAGAAAYAKEVARSLRQNVESAFMCGLLHDVGKPLVMIALLDLAKERTDRAVPRQLLEAAMDEFHEDVGAMMVSRWELPDWMSVPIAHHHNYENAPEHATETMITHLADHLSHWALDESSTEEDFPAELEVIADLNLYADTVSELLARRGPILEITEAFL